MLIKFIKDVRLGFDMALAKKRLENKIFYTPNIITNFQGIDIALDDDVILSNLGTNKNLANACAFPKLNAVFVNSAFLELDEVIQNAIYWHELGHLEHQHDHGEASKVDVDYALKCECEADLYSHLKCGNMLAALDVMISLHGDRDPALIKRRMALHSYINAN